ncbi:sigma-54-dependent transcriptional regulator [Agaribacterium sp. ZY112]|uniref:sigma-54-dependent transcriptional regulator n=1 Tax=Agaribacterium sp. ZY112 TaxID=3233574 RepID=UPI0035254055
MYKVLIIDDNPDIGSALKVLLSLHRIESEYACSPEEGLELIHGHDDIGLVIQDMNFTHDTTSGEEGERLFIAIRELKPDLPVIIITAWTQLEAAVRLVRLGAVDYVAKPWDDEKLMATVENLLELHELQAQQLLSAKRIKDEKLELAERANLCGVIYEAPKMQKLLDVAVRVAPSDIPVLITGPNGAGKEKIAEVIQANSRVKDGPFIAVNLGALPAELIEAELFGAEAGAYSGATKRRIGRFEAADGGTLFLDELGNLSPQGQMKLLRVLQTGQFERLGSNVTQTVRVRVISATNTDLQQAIREGRFREDLYYRLNVLELQLPALRDRPEDIVPLLNHFLGSERDLEPEASQKLQRYAWPGNVRELENSVQRAILLSDSRTISLADFGLNMQGQVVTASGNVEPNKQDVEQAIKEYRGVITHAARALGLSRQALYRRIEKFQIEISSDVKK